MIIADRASFHRSVAVRKWVRAHRTKIRMFFFPSYAPELHPDEPVWNELKHRQLGQQPIKNQLDLKERIRSILNSLPHKAKKVRSFFQLPDTKYADIPEAAT